MRVKRKKMWVAALVLFAILASRVWHAYQSGQSMLGWLLALIGGILAFLLEYWGSGQDWLEEEVEPKKGEGSGGLL